MSGVPCPLGLAGVGFALGHRDRRGLGFPGEAGARSSDRDPSTIPSEYLERSNAQRSLCFEEMSFTVNDRTRPSISCSRRRGPYVVFADSISAYAIRDVHPEALRAMATIDSGEEVPVAEIFHGWLASFSAPPVTDEALLQFRHWPRVQKVRLFRTWISDAGLDALTAANNLRRLSLSDTTITDEGPVCFFAGVRKAGADADPGPNRFGVGLPPGQPSCKRLLCSRCRVSTTDAPTGLT